MHVIGRSKCFAQDFKMRVDKWSGPVPESILRPRSTCKVFRALTGKTLTFHAGVHIQICWNTYLRLQDVEMPWTKILLRIDLLCPLM